jgi:uncharacterized repeat protein (TIGR03803 family)
MRKVISSAIAIFAFSVFTGCSSAPQSGFSPSVASLHTGAATSRFQRRNSSEAVLYSFVGSPTDGTAPFAGLTKVGGALYGTTEVGGANNDGTVFKISTSGAEQVVYSFAGGTDGATPYGGLVKVGNKLYGTTAFGGSNNNGTVYSVTTAGVEKVLYRFAGSPSDGATPYATLANLSGTLYGTTDHGGADENGTIFSITTSGAYHQLHSFTGAPSDGAHPYAGFINVSGTFYGATTVGGSSDAGTIYTLTPSGSENVLYSFAGGMDGAMPYACCAKVGQALYGTTVAGGMDHGTVFKLTIAGVEKVLHRFKGGNDGAEPFAGLTSVNGKLYGVTQQQGANGNGTIFSITTSGAYNRLYTFVAQPDGSTPYGTLLNVSGTLYGTTFAGGSTGSGTVFSFLP